MLAKERLLRIVNLLNTYPSMSIQELCKVLEVSTSTVQRDLLLLEKEGKIKRERGGAVQLAYGETLTDLNEIAVYEKVNLNVEQKQRICKQAIAHVHQGDCIFIDSGTTPVHLLPYLMNMNIKIVTNSHFLVQKLTGCLAQVFLLGGEYSFKYGMSLGSITQDELQKFRFDCAFLGANGLDIKTGELYSAEFEIGAIKQQVMKRSKQVFGVIDSSKFDVTGICTYGNIKEFTGVYVDAYTKGMKKPNNVHICE